ncbi:hypothetical protein [Dyadobacter sandarakinus]|uniref:Uncharacterized protein n=1 Tax=Dyadobacter sandarakinus TaxID=2747268 RepID=A0ABX7I0Y4_9BACT|nr:hypothetical protein [Dyadobacter sandarakinus]QRQ99497.1 hypothetical protein HWI92_00500 [Dyadobacter sandarakinus]
MIAKRLEYNALVSKDFLDMTVGLKNMVREVRFRINEVVTSQAILPKVARSLSCLKDAISAHQTATVTLKDVSGWNLYLTEIVAELEAFCTSNGLDID